MTAEKLVPLVRETVFDPSLSDACLEISELGLDTLVEQGAFSGVPILGLITGIGKTILNVRERNFVKQTAAFANSFNTGNITEEKYEEYKRKITDNPEFGEKELGRIILLVDAMFDEERSRLLGKVYAAYVNEDMSWDEFLEMSDVVSRMYVPDIKLLFRIYSKQVADTTKCKPYQAERLKSLGLLVMSIKSIHASLDSQITDSYVCCSKLGNKLCTCALQHGYVAP